MRRIAGIDEAGRGPLAGPVVAAAVILPPNFDICVTDSKKLTPKKRNALYGELITRVEYGIGVVDASRIDEINILQATFEAMNIAIGKVSPDYIQVDGTMLPQTKIAGEAIVKGDLLVGAISAASIIAKEYRDRLMLTYHEKWPEYGFDRHKGYGTKFHLEAIEKFGLSSIHRKTFREAGRTEILTSSR